MFSELNSFVGLPTSLSLPFRVNQKSASGKFNLISQTSFHLILFLFS